MGEYESQVVAFARYAAAQVAYGERALALHQVDGTSCCRFCGRVWPCDQARHGQQMVDHFSQWAAAEETERPPLVQELVRPYVRPASGRPIAR